MQQVLQPVLYLFMERFLTPHVEVAQLGRRGALMLTLDIAHPDVKNLSP